MKLTELISMLESITKSGVDITDSEIMLYDFASGESQEIDDVGLDGDNNLVIKFDYNS